MKIFGQIVRTAVNTVTLPVAVVKDAFTLGGIATDNGQTYTVEHLKRLKREAEED